MLIGKAHLLPTSGAPAASQSTPRAKGEGEGQAPGREEAKRAEARRALDAVRYLQRAYVLIERAEECAEERAELPDEGVGKIGAGALNLGELKVRAILH